jgi:sugar lactone lactonase YvrE
VTTITTTGSNVGVLALAVDDTQLYVSDHDTIRAYPRDSDGGATPKVLSPNNSARFSLALDDAYVYWRVGNQIERAKKDGTASPERISSADPENAYAATLAADANGVYWTTVGATPDGGAQLPNKLYVKTGADIVVRAKGFGTPAGLALDATHAYFLDVDKGEVLRVARVGASPYEVIARWTTPKRYVRGLRVDDTHVYWMVTMQAGTYDAHLFRAPKCGGGDVETLVAGEGATGPVDDATSVYYQSLGQLLRVRK